MATTKLTWETATTGTGGVHSLASSSDFTAGYEWFVITNSASLDLDFAVQGTVRVGTTPTAGTQIRVWVVGSYDGTTWPSPVAGSAAARTWATAGARDSVAKLAAVLSVDAATTDADYDFFFTLGSLFGGIVPKKVSVYLSHNTAVALEATSGNQKYAYVGVYTTTV